MKNLNLLIATVFCICIFSSCKKEKLIYYTAPHANNRITFKCDTGSIPWGSSELIADSLFPRYHAVIQAHSGYFSTGKVSAHINLQFMECGDYYCDSVYPFTIGFSEIGSFNSAQYYAEKGAIVFHITSIERDPSDNSYGVLSGTFEGKVVLDTSNIYNWYLGHYTWVSHCPRTLTINNGVFNRIAFHQ